MRVAHRFERSGSDDVLMTPMIDVVFLLLIFFVCTASFQVAEQVLPSNLLAAGSVATEIVPPLEQPLERIVIRLRHAGGEPAWLVNDRPYGSLVEVQAVLVALAEIDPALPVVLDIGGSVPVGEMINVYDLCRVAGFSTVQFAASVPTGAGE
ncbi:MAG: biopolymer transporter ExbD [Pirellulales bacterium]